MTILLYVLLGASLAFGLVFAIQHFWGFRAQETKDYANTGPDFDIRRHLNGPILCEGVIYGPLGRVTSRFIADFEASWDGNHGTMREVFRYDNGSQQDREWRLRVDDSGIIQAEADDLIGAGRGQQLGASVRLDYRIKLPTGHVLDTTDWMYLVENGAIINRSQFRKFGFKVAELVATMRPKETA